MNDFVNGGSGINIANSDFTVSAWVRRGSFGTWDVIWGQGGSPGSENNSLHIGFRNTNVFTCAFWSNDLNTVATYTDSDWHLWTCTYNASTNERIIYRDAVSVANDTALADFLGTGDFLLGDSAVATDAFDGSMDDVRVYDRVLSPAEISRLYQLGATTKIAKTITTNPDLERGLVGHWTFDGKDIDTSAVTAEVLDRSGNGNNGDWKNHATTTVPGKIGQALDFDGSNDYVDVGAFVIPSQGTMVAWYKISSSDRQGIAGSLSDQSFRFILNYKGGTGGSSPGFIGFHPDGDTVLRGDIELGSIVYDGDWHQTVFSWQGNQLREWFDVQEYAIRYQNQNSVNGNSIAQFVFGKEFSVNTNLDGSIDDVRIYSRALSAEEITRLYQLGN